MSAQRRKTAPSPAIFLDRDGVIIENRPHYVRSWADVEIFGQALAALRRVRRSPYRVVIITNQSMVGRGLVPAETAQAINDRLLEVIEAAGGRVDAVFMCPHAPEDECECRKPRPGLIQQAARELNLDLKRSLLVGDALTDLQAGRAAGVGQLALVKTGRGAEQLRLEGVEQVRPFGVYGSLREALMGGVRG